MKQIKMSQAELDNWTAQYAGDRTDIFYDNESLNVPDELFDEAFRTFEQMTPDAALALLKQSLIADVNSEAERQRLQYITPGAGQAMTYTEKLAQARAFLTAEAPVLSNYQMIVNEVGITAADAAGVAEAVVAAYAIWAEIGAGIERVRMETNKALAAALDATAAQNIRNSVVWPVGG